METIETSSSQEQRPLNFKEWALHIFLVGIPLVGLILLLVWAFNDSGNIHRKEWAKGMLLLYLIFHSLGAFSLSIWRSRMVLRG